MEHTILMKPTVWMIGHSNHTWPKFLSLLTQHGIKYLVDVRNRPQSRFSPQFNAGHMMHALSQAGIQYAHVSLFGGKAPQPKSILKPALADFLGREGRTPQIAMVCSEGKFIECHRHYLLAPVIIELGDQIIQ